MGAEQILPALDFSLLFVGVQVLRWWNSPEFVHSIVWIFCGWFCIKSPPPPQVSATFAALFAVDCVVINAIKRSRNISDLQTIPVKVSLSCGELLNNSIQLKDASKR